jgi:Tol biopolymer transport system component
MRTHRRQLILLAVAALTLLAIVPVSEALHRQTPSLLQVTTIPSQDVGGAKFIGGSNLVVFHSDADLLGNGNTIPNIFIFDLKLRSKNHLEGIFQMTFGAQPSRRPSAARRGRTLAFESEADLLNNGSTGLQVFAADHVVSHKGPKVPLFQVTKASSSSFDAHLSENGRFLVFTSTADLRNEGLPAGTHLYRSDLKKAHLGEPTCPAYPCNLNPGLDLLTREVAGRPSIDKLGLLVAFESAGDVLGPGTSNGFSQVYVYDFNLNLMRRMTNGLADSRNAVMIRNGTKVVFESAANLIGNGNARFNIFEADIAQPLPVTHQLTFGTDGDSTAPSVNAKADRIVFSSTATLTAGANGMNQLYLLELDGNHLTRLTSVPDAIDESSTELNFFVFTSSSDLTGNGNSQPQVFLGNTFKLLDPSLPTPTPLATP